MRDWELDFPAFARLFDVTLEPAASERDEIVLPGIPSAFLDGAGRRRLAAGALMKASGRRRVRQ